MINNISNNNLIILNRGDTIYLPVLINIGTTCNPNIYTLKNNDKVFLSVYEAHQPFERGIIRKICTAEDQNLEGYVNFKFEMNDTLNLLPGTYYYEVKLIKALLDNDISSPLEDVSNEVKTIISKRKFIILD